MRRPTPGELTLLAILAAGATAIIHHRVAGLPLINDDYLVLRPWSRAELLSTLTGTWDPYHLNEVYHRPLEALLQAAQFWLFGINAKGLHLLSLAGVAVVAWLLGIFVKREGGSSAAACAAVLIFVAHPSLPDAVSAWIFQQMHIAASIVMVAMMLLWQRARDQPAKRWWPILSLAVIGFYLKEDTVLVLPGILTAQFLCARVTGTMPKPPYAVLAATALLGLLLAAIRVSVFPHFVDSEFQWFPRSPDVWRTRLHMLGYGPWHTLAGMPFADRLNNSAALLLDALLIGGLAAAWRAHRTRGRRAEGISPLWLIGASMMAWVNLPQMFMGGWTRDHLVLVSAVLIITAAVDALWRSVSGIRPALVAAMAALLVMFAMISQRITTRFESCDPFIVEQAGMMRNEPWIWPDLGDYLGSIPAGCAAGTLRPWNAQDMVMWRAGPWQKAADGSEARALDANAVALLREGTTNIELTVRDSDATPDRPSTVRVAVGGAVESVSLASPDWQRMEIPVADNWRTRLRGGERIDFAIDARGRVPRVQLKRK